MENYVIVNGELHHSGIKGMKWGVRRYRNKDGSLTPAGKKRYAYAPRIVRGHAGPGVYVGSPERRLAGAKKDLAILDNGGHLSVGFTKKRQAAYDRRDRSALEKKVSKLEDKIEKSKPSDDARRASEIKKKKVSQMSNAELRTLNERTRLEQEYSRLNPGAVKKGWKFVAGTAGVMGTALAVYNNGHQLVELGKKFVKI